ncbi:hypothetical protein ACWEVM_24540 [Streptomyces bauhiniae]|uniref:hypothetical protein n=1 Tax=Streptomyces bauhiniae TaxID=2340725 RepID=UPI0036BA77B4
MDAFLYLVPGVMFTGCVFGAVQVIRRARRTSKLWAQGRMAEGRCLNTYMKTSGGHDNAVRSTLHHVYGADRAGERLPVGVVAVGCVLFAVSAHSAV